jgi:hypothetical protein
VPLPSGILPPVESDGQGGDNVADAQAFDGPVRWRGVGPFRIGRVVTVSGSYDEPNAVVLGSLA